MARTNVPIVTNSASGAATGAGTTADPTNDHVVDLAGYPLENVTIRLTNTNGTDRVATIVAGDYPPALSAGLGNLAVTVPATSGDVTIAGLESARYLQADGTIHIDLAASYAGAVRVTRPA